MSAPDPGPTEAREMFLADVLAGLRSSPKTLPSKYLYDEPGSILFDRITELDEYYPTRTELGILRDHAPEMAARLGAGCLIIEYGSGSGNKTDALLDHVLRPAAYAPVDVAREHLLAAAERVAAAYPDIEVHPIVGDFTGEFAVPKPSWIPERRVVYFPGSTIGNFAPAAAAALLRQIAAICGPGGALLVGVDLQKPREVLQRAYDDSLGVTAAFNLNVLHRINRELGANFDVDCFRHRAPWNEDEGRIEMHLESLRDQQVEIAGERIEFAAGESICTEYSTKYTLEGFAERASSAGLAVREVWTDPQQWFSIQYCEVL